MVRIIIVAALTLASCRPQLSRAFCAAEARLATPIVDDQRPAFGKLLEYYRDSNRELFAEMHAVKSAYRKRRNHHGVSYVVGSAGKGKSYLRDELLRPPKQGLCKINLKELVGRSKTSRVDLASVNNKVIFNRLPVIEDADRFHMVDLLREAGCLKNKLSPFVIVDDLDEIHPDSAQWVLKEIDTFIEARRANFIHFLVFGRIEAFMSRLQSLSGKVPKHAKIFLLGGVKLRNTNDLRFTMRSYYTYRKWGKPPVDHENRLIELVRLNPFLSYSMSNLAFSNFTMEHAREGAPTDAILLKDSMYSRLLDRNYNSHGRPRDLKGTYARLLRKIAHEYACGISENGYFGIRSDDTVAIIADDGEEVDEVLVHKVLQRSGLAILKPDDYSFREMWFRFEPFWLHVYLANQHARQEGSHTIAGCDPN